MKTLTSRQRDVVACIRQHLTSHGYPPSVREVAESLAITSNAAIGHLAACERKGHIRRVPGIARGITLIDSSGSGSRQDHHHASRQEIDG